MPRPGLLDQAGLVAQRPGEGAADVAEQLALQQMVGDGRAIDGDEGRRGPAPRVWISRAISSLPVPLSPMIRTGASRFLTLSIKVQDAAEGFARPDQDAVGRGHGWFPPPPRRFIPPRHKEGRPVAPFFSPRLTSCVFCAMVWGLGAWNDDPKNQEPRRWDNDRSGRIYSHPLHRRRDTAF